MAEHSFCSGSNRMFSGHGWYRAGSNIYVQSTNSTKTKGIIVVNREKKYALSFFAKGAGAYCGSVIVPHLVKSEGGDYYVFHSQTEAPKTSPYPFYLGKFRGNGHEFFIEYAEPLGLYARHRKYNMPEASAPVALLAFNEFMLVVKTNVAGWPADSRQIMYVQEGDKPSSYIKVGNILLTRY
jgi:hypothetical protein